ncbi:1-acyl-sn-glycerol-3-phosphate acyltransferase, partial [bacterium]|nr:1-acyl-sn-glycerol-3-phosphate acyltransferase [bacterium]
IYCSNHASHLDALAIICSSKLPVNDFVVIAAKDYFFRSRLKQFFVKLLMDIAPIHREPTLDQMRENILMLKEQIRKKKNLIIFPEGTRSIDGSIHKFKPGLGYMAKKLDVPIVPVYIHGTYFCLPKGKNVPKAGRVEVSIGSPILSNSSWRQLKNQDLSNYVHAQIINMSKSDNEPGISTITSPVLSANEASDELLG